jgi:hypothetical protein
MVRFNCQRGLEKLPPVRRKFELQRAHDLLMTSLLHGDLRSHIPEEMLKPMMYCADCLCLALNHECIGHAEDFAVLLASLESLIGGVEAPRPKELIQ